MVKRKGGGIGKGLPQWALVLAWLCGLIEGGGDLVMVDD
jgi:hypothetical protein